MMFIHSHFFLCILLALIMVTAVSIVYIRHLSNTQFAVLQQLAQERDQIDEQWGRLLLEESTHKRLSLIEQRAYSQLDMVMPTRNILVVVSP